MNKFGFTISQGRQINFDEIKTDKVEKMLELVPSYKLCIGCGGCTAACTAAGFTDYNIRRIHTAFQRGQYNGLEEKLQRCMLCGKCLLVCPRGVNTRSLIVNMRRILANVEPVTWRPQREIKAESHEESHK
ncbi:MAG: 4Fe-4S dicluster domain-containing protein [Bacteroidales bacterium]|nr:4Fe-4S dicluster domain-containing protein [Bacteroidales bacterium]MCR5193307.1 4Fe-4S dicluster domain-containing protein [Bacteroidales bacterium]